MAVNQLSPRATDRGRGLFMLPLILDNSTISVVCPLSLWNNAHDVSVQQRIRLIHSIALDTKVGYLLATYTLRLSLRIDCCTESKVCFLCSFTGCQSTQALTPNPAHSC